MKIGGVFTAVLILSLVAIPTWAQAPKVMHALGRVTAVAADSVTVQAGAKTMTFMVDAETKVEGKGVGTKSRSMQGADKKGPAVTDLVSAADSVVVDYHDLGGDKFHAVKINIKVKSFKK